MKSAKKDKVSLLFPPYPFVLFVVPKAFTTKTTKGTK